jgi:hypothetical protein
LQYTVSKSYLNCCNGIRLLDFSLKCQPQPQRHKPQRQTQPETRTLADELDAGRGAEALRPADVAKVVSNLPARAAAILFSGQQRHDYN